MDSDDVGEVIDLEEGCDDGENDDGEMAQEDVEEEDLQDELDVQPDATVTDEDNSAITSKEHRGSVYCISARNSADGMVALTGSGDDTGMMWSLAPDSMQPKAVLHGHSDTVVACGFTSTPKCYGATGSYDGTIRVWKPDGTQLHLLEGPSADIEWLCWHDRGDVILAGSADCTAWMWSITDSNATCMQVFAGHEGEVTCGIFAAQGKVVVTGSSDNSVRVWDPKTGQASMTFSGSGWSDGPITCLSSSSTSPVIIAGSQDGTGRIANVSTKRVIGVLVHDAISEGAESVSSVESVIFDVIQNWAYTGGTDGYMSTWDLNTLARRTHHHMSGGVIKLLQMPDRNLLAASTVVGCIDLLDARTEGTMLRLSGHKGMVLDFQRCDDIIITAGDDNFVKVFDLRKILAMK